MINDDNIMDLSDFGDRNVKEEFAHIKDSLISLEKLIEAKEKDVNDSEDVAPKYLKTTLRESFEELSLPIEEKCDALELKINTLTESINQIQHQQKNNSKLILCTAIGVGIMLLLVLYVLFFFFFGA